MRDLVICQAELSLSRGESGAATAYDVALRRRRPNSVEISARGLRVATRGPSLRSEHEGRALPSRNILAQTGIPAKPDHGTPFLHDCVMYAQEHANSPFTWRYPSTRVPNPANDLGGVRPPMRWASSQMNP